MVRVVLMPAVLDWNDRLFVDNGIRFHERALNIGLFFLL